MTLSSLSNFITTRLGRMKAYNSLDWVTCYPLHFTLAYIVYRESQTHQVVYIHVHYGVHSEIYIGRDSRLIDLSLCCIIRSQIKKKGFWLPNQNYWYLVTGTISGQFSWSRRDKEWLSALMKNCGASPLGGGSLCKIRAAWTVYTLLQIDKLKW